MVAAKNGKLIYSVNGFESLKAVISDGTLSIVCGSSLKEVKRRKRTSLTEDLSCHVAMCKEKNNHTRNMCVVFIEENGKIEDNVSAQILLTRSHSINKQFCFSLRSSTCSWRHNQDTQQLEAIYGKRGK